MEWKCQNADNITSNYVNVSIMYNCDLYKILEHENYNDAIVFYFLFKSFHKKVNPFETTKSLRKLIMQKWWQTDLCNH